MQLHDLTHKLRDLTADELTAIFEVGYTVVADVFALSALRPLEAACERLEIMAQELFASGQRGTVMHRGSQFVLGEIADGRRAGQVRIDRVVWAGAAAPELLEFSSHPQLLRWAAQVLGSSHMEQLINQVHFKLPGDGVTFSWHQDAQHRRYGTEHWQDLNGKGSFVEIATLLDDNTQDNGPLQFVRDSCRLGNLPLGPDGNLPSEYVLADKIESAVAPAGSVILFGPFAIHGSGVNRSQRKRRLLLNGFCLPGANFRQYPGQGSGRQVVAG